MFNWQTVPPNSDYPQVLLRWVSHDGLDTYRYMVCSWSRDRNGVMQICDELTNEITTFDPGDEWLELETHFIL